MNTNGHRSELSATAGAGRLRGDGRLRKRGLKRRATFSNRGGLGPPADPWGGVWGGTMGVAADHKARRGRRGGAPVPALAEASTVAKARVDTGGEAGPVPRSGFRVPGWSAKIGGGGGRKEGSGRKGARRGGRHRRMWRYLASISRQEPPKSRQKAALLPDLSAIFAANAARVQGAIGGGRGEKEAG